MARYIICPRCELNFIDADEREYCEVCEKELSGDTSYVEALEEEAAEDMELCPLCGEVYVKLGEKMCEECAHKNEYEEEVGLEDEDKEDDTWRSYLDDDDTEDLGISMEDVGFDLEDEEEEEEEEESYAEEEWEEVSADDYDESLDDDDDDDDDDDF
jgi:hypothetical protein